VLLYLCLSVVSAGFYVPAGSAVATACPRGTFKSEPGATTSCTSCPAGVTTEAEGSTSAADCTSESKLLVNTAVDADADAAWQRQRAAAAAALLSCSALLVPADVAFSHWRTTGGSGTAPSFLT
jgi:hypothetical protein